MWLTFLGSPRIAVRMGIAAWAGPALRWGEASVLGLGNLSREKSAGCGVIFLNSKYYGA